MSEFIWTDELLGELLSKVTSYYPGGNYWADEIAAFKAAKQPKPEWEIEALNFHTPHNWLWDSSVNAYFMRGHTMRFTRQELYEGDNGQGNISIVSVKRLSDGEVFTVGDEICLEGAKELHKIIGFGISDGGKDMFAHFSDFPRYSHHYWSKSVPK